MKKEKTDWGINFLETAKLALFALRANVVKNIV